MLQMKFPNDESVPGHVFIIHALLSLLCETPSSSEYSHKFLSIFPLKRLLGCILFDPSTHEQSVLVLLEDFSVVAFLCKAEGCILCSPLCYIQAA